MAIKRTDREEEEFQEILEALQEDYEKLMSGPDSESGLIAFWTDQSGKTVHIKRSDGDHGSISSAEYDEIKKRIGEKCLVCAGLLGFIFDPVSKPVLYLSCNRCEKSHKVVLGELCLTDD